MTERVTVELPEELVRQVRTVAQRTRRSFDEVLAECVRRAGSEPAVESLSDAELLAECDRTFSEDEQDELSDLLEGNRESTLDAAERRRLEELMQVYRAGLVRKAQALNVAVGRGLRPRLN